ncbi:MAG: TetR family transcriptional regulator, partial [Stackebrandtia sp.]
MDGNQGLRERKKEKTRRALITAAAGLFGRLGYEETTVAEIAAAADVSTRTFFSYFPSKEAVLFADAGDRVQVARDVIAGRRPDEHPVELLMRAVDEAIGDDPDILGQLGPVRVRLVLETPALHGLMMRHVLAAESQITESLLAAFPGELGKLPVAAMVGSLIGGLVSTAIALLADPERIQEMLDHPDRMQTEIKGALHEAFQS